MTKFAAGTKVSPETSRAEIERLREWGRLLIERGAIFTASTGGKFTGDAFLRMADAAVRSFDEPDRIAAARAEGVVEGSERVLREIREAGVRLSEASMDEAATALAARVAPTIAEARAAGYREGVEEAAAWVDREAANCEALGAKVMASDYRHIAASLRSLIPSPAPVEPITPEPPMTDRTAPQPDSEGWIAWTSSELPVPGDTLVRVRFRNGVTSHYDSKAHSWLWGDVDGDWDIIAYRPVSPAQDVGPERLATAVTEARIFLEKEGGI